MATLPCEGTYDGYEDYEEYESELFPRGSKARKQLEDDWDYDGELDAAEARLESYADSLYDEVQCGDITPGQARSRFNRAKKRRLTI